ncbi:MAG: hypothetical protein IKJ99_06540 [Oscillospiraceae bacterium]|nr:hypothetical protein [Oscillospiraceae bacterium]
MMYEDTYDKLHKIETSPEALASTRAFLAEHLRIFMYKEEPVLICFPDNGPESFGGIVGQAVRDCGGVPVFWGPDYRWKELLRQAFHTHAHTIVAHPLIVLGLMKVAKATATPLYIHNVVLGGYPYARWMLEGIKKGLDCKVWGCYSVRSGPVVVGFTCDREAGIHIRDERFRAVVLSEQGDPLPDPKRGRLMFESREDPSLIYDPQETSTLLHQPCSCGCDAPRIVETVYVGKDNPSKAMLEERFLAWSSILDYRATQTEFGVDLELVVFPGESLPKIHSCAKLTVRPWNPDEDVPFYMEENFLKLSEKYW